MNTPLLLFASILPIVIIAKYIYNKDKEKEPKKLLSKLFISGIASCLLTLIITIILEITFPFFKTNSNNLNLLQLIIYVFVKIALVEEFSKWIMTYTISYDSKEFDQLYDMIIYSVFVSLGFACFENIIYVLNNGLETAITRALLAVPGHACDGIFMGYYLGIAKISKVNNNENLKRKNLVLSLLIPTILHGIYDYCIYSKKILFIIIFYIFIITIYNLSLKKIKKISNITKKIQYPNNYCPNCKIPINSNYCPYCGRKKD